MHQLLAVWSDGAGGWTRTFPLPLPFLSWPVRSPWSPVVLAGLAAAGATVAVADLLLDQADGVLDEIAASGRPGLALPMDVTSAASVQSVVDRLLADVTCMHC